MIYNSFRSYLYEMTARDAIADIKKLKIPKDISKLSRSQAQQKCPEVLKFYDELIDTIRKSSYTKSIDFIDDIIKEPKLKLLLSLGFGGNFASLNLNPTINTNSPSLTRRFRSRSALVPFSYVLYTLRNSINLPVSLLFLTVPQLHFFFFPYYRPLFHGKCYRNVTNLRKKTFPNV